MNPSPIDSEMNQSLGQPGAYVNSNHFEIDNHQISNSRGNPMVRPPNIPPQFNQPPVGGGQMGRIPGETTRQGKMSAPPQFSSQHQPPHQPPQFSSQHQPQQFSSQHQPQHQHQPQQFSSQHQPQQFSSQHQQHGGQQAQRNISPEQAQRMKQINHMTKANYQQHMQKFEQMNDKIMGHHMSNMASFVPEVDGVHTDNYSFDQGMPESDMVPTPRETGYGFGAAAPAAPAPAPPPRMPNQRNCECKQGQGYCAGCQVCGMPGHRRHYPGQEKSGGNQGLGQWCDMHYERARAHAMKTNPGAFTGFETFDPLQPTQPSKTVNPANRSGQYVGPMNSAKVPQGTPQASNTFKPGHNSVAYGNKSSHQQIVPPELNSINHHNDRKLGGDSNPAIGGLPNPVQKSPYELNNKNIDNFKGNNPYTLSRTVVNPRMFNQHENIDYAGYNAQGEKVRNSEYYKNTPGRQNEHDFYREYKKNLQNPYYVPSNSEKMGNFKPYQIGAEPRKVKLSRDNIQQHGLQTK